MSSFFCIEFSRTLKWDPGVCLKGERPCRALVKLSAGDTCFSFPTLSYVVIILHFPTHPSFFLESVSKHFNVRVFVPVSVDYFWCLLSLPPQLENNFYHLPFSLLWTSFQLLQFMH